MLHIVNKVWSVSLGTLKQLVWLIFACCTIHLLSPTVRILVLLHTLWAFSGTPLLAWNGSKTYWLQQVAWCSLIWLYWYFSLSASSPWQRKDAVVIAKGPHPEPPTWYWMFRTGHWYIFGQCTLEQQESFTELKSCMCIYCHTLFLDGNRFVDGMKFKEFEDTLTRVHETNVKQCVSQGRKIQWWEETDLKQFVYQWK